MLLDSTAVLSRNLLEKWLLSSQRNPVLSRGISLLYFASFLKAQKFNFLNYRGWLFRTKCGQSYCESDKLHTWHTDKELETVMFPVSVDFRLPLQDPVSFEKLWMWGFFVCYTMLRSMCFRKKVDSKNVPLSSHIVIPPKSTWRHSLFLQKKCEIR